MNYNQTYSCSCADMAGKFNPAEFISTVTGATGEDFIGLALGSPHNTYFPTLKDLADDVLYGQNILNTNCWFCGSALDGKGRKKENCLSIQSIILDIDYGTAGHKRPSPFPDYQSALDHILAQKVQPQIIWHSGHGFCLGFILDKIVRFSDEDTAALYEREKARINKVFRGDDTCSREHLFRVPCSANKKPGCDSVMGTLLRCEVLP